MGDEVRCEGSQPTCKTCQAYHSECRYEKLPSMSQVLDMAKRLQEAEQTIAELRAAAGVTAATMASKLPAHTLASPTVEDEGGSLSVPSPTPVPHAVAQLIGNPPPPSQNVQAEPGEELPPGPTPKGLLHDLSLDEDGRICYYGPTSAVHDPPAMPPPSAHSPGHPDRMTKTTIRSVLAAKSQESRSWEDFALGAAAVQSDIPRPVVAKLLHIHWTWISPMFMWVYRPAFMRDMSTAGPYYSEFLLVVLCAHAARFQDNHVADMLISKARLLLGTAVQQPVSIPTVQALLQLSARDLAFGSISHAWLYSGMAFRMARDLGLHHSVLDAPGLTDLGPVDIEVRKRLFWSCYFWDKAISLYTGRMPALTELPENATVEFFIINDIISQLYCRWENSNAGHTRRIIAQRLDSWRAESPLHLVCDPDNLPDVCPPPHILSQNLLYYTTVILAHRPFWSVAVHYEACISAAHSIEKLLLLLERTFGFDNITYLMAYCIYTGASAILREARSGNAEASTKIQTFVRALQSGAKRCPLLERSLSLIRKGLHSPLDRSSTPRSVAVFDDDATAVYNYVPAFPYFGYSDVGDFDFSENPSGINLDTFSTLNCFPEAYM
ncbi:Transcription factor [Niveomyces insectorum RCEF 264]|uniref:Transcription factor n=1 Tax=Niveomyces insectorum RCEF 264 TaxID=1081102 RepID=A0A167TUH2_9HYPO|nr:Transcription factor [Niveomyces insectorum RCEF 264]